MAVDLWMEQKFKELLQNIINYVYSYKDIMTEPWLYDTHTYIAKIISKNANIILHNDGQMDNNVTRYDPCL